MSIGHAVVWDTSSTMGTAPADNTTIDLTLTAGSLTIAAGVTLTIKGNIEQRDAGFNAGAGSALVFDTTAGDRTWWIGTANGQTNCSVNFDGSAGARWDVHKTGGNRAWVQGPSGSPSFPELDFRLKHGQMTGIWDGVTGNTARGIKLEFDLIKHLNIQDVLFDACGTIMRTNKGWYGDAFGPPYTGTTWNISDCRWSNTPASVDSASFVMASAVVGEATILRNSFDKPCNGNRADKMRVEDNYFGEGFSCTVAPGLTWNYNTVRIVDSAVTQGFLFDVGPTYVLADFTHGNPHFTGPDSACALIDGLICEYPHAFAIDRGDGLINSGGWSGTVQNCIMLPSETDGASAGNLTNFGGTCAAVVEHCTIVGDDAMLVIVQDYSASGLEYTRVRDNLVVSNNPAVKAHVTFSAHTDTDSFAIITGSGVTNNGVVNGDTFTDTSNGSAVYTGYTTKFFASGTPGSGDITRSSGAGIFADAPAAWRNGCKFAVSKGQASSGDTVPTKVAALCAYLAADPTRLRTEFIPYLKEGYAVADSGMRTGAHDGTVMGWVQDAPAGSARRLLSLRRKAVLAA